MPTLTPPPLPDDEPLFIEPTVVQSVSQSEYNRIKEFLTIEPWLCSSCELKNFGRNERCANFKCRNPKSLHN